MVLVYQPKIMTKRSSSFAKVRAEGEGHYDIQKVLTHYAQGAVHRDTTRINAYLQRCIKSGCTDINKIIMLYDFINPVSKLKILSQIFSS